MQLQQLLHLALPMLPEFSLHDRRPSLTPLDVPPNFSAEQSQPAHNGLVAANHAPPFHDYPANDIPALPFSPPAHVHIPVTSPSISGYLDFTSPLSYSPPTTPSTALTSTAVSRKTSADDLLAAVSSSAGSLERFPRRICSAFFVYFVSFLSLCQIFTLMTILASYVDGEMEVCSRLQKRALLTITLVTGTVLPGRSQHTIDIFDQAQT
jgi:hypothetical protein